MRVLTTASLLACLLIASLWVTSFAQQFIGHLPSNYSWTFRSVGGTLLFERGYPMPADASQYLSVHRAIQYNSRSAPRWTLGLLWVDQIANPGQGVQPWVYDRIIGVRHWVIVIMTAILPAY